MNRILRSGSGDPRPRTISDKTLAAPLLPGTAVFIGATQLTQATAVSGGRLGILGDRDYYSIGGIGIATNPLMTPYAAGESGIAYLPKPDDEFAMALAAGTYTVGQELTVGAAGRLTAAAAGNIVIAHYDQPSKTVAAGELADVVISNFYAAMGTAPVAPVIATPTSVGVASTYSPAAASQQWAMDGADQSGATSATYTQALADAAKVLTVRTPGGTSPGALPGMRNWKASNTVNLRAMMAGGVRGRLIGFGDSYIAGHGANGVVNDGNRAKSWITRLAATLTGKGIPASASFAFGGSNSALDAAALAAYDSRYSFSGTGTGLLGNVDVPGGNAIGLTAAGDKVTFTPGGTFDTVDILFPRNTSGQGNFTVSVDGGTTVIQTVENSSVADVGYVSVPVPAGSTAVTISKGTGFCYLTMIGTRTAGAPGIEVYCAGKNGTQLQVMAWAPAAAGNRLWVSRSTLMKLCNNSAKNAILINGWYNDRSSGGRTLQQASDDLRVLLAELKTYADVVYCGYASLGGAIGTGADFRLWQDEMMRVAIEEFDIPVFDMSRVLTSQAANPSYYYDQLHLGLTGHPLPTASIVAQMLAI